MSGTSAELLSNHVCQRTENIARDSTVSQVEVTYYSLSFLIVLRLLSLASCLSYQALKFR